MREHSNLGNSVQEQACPRDFAPSFSVAQYSVFEKDHHAKRLE